MSKRLLSQALRLQRQYRGIHSTSIRYSTGVHPALNNMRVQIPWLEALKNREKASSAPSEPSPPPQSAERPVTPRKMSDSYTSITLQLGHDPWLIDNYVNSSGHLRIGSLFADLDALAGVCAYKHAVASEGKQDSGDLMIVTAAVDRINILHTPSSFVDLKLHGGVTWTSGRSSMEISLKVDTEPGPEATGADAERKTVMECAFTMVALDRNTKKAVTINPLVVETAEEKKIFARGERRNKEKRAIAQKELTKVPPDAEESALIHNMYLSAHHHQTHSPHKRPVSSTRIHSTQIMQPPHRNRHSFMIFGGYLMQLTFELAFCCASSFSHIRPHFLSLDPSVFRKSVPIGSILYLTATVAFVEHSQSGARVHVRVDSKVRDVEHSKAEDSGTFNFTFLCAEGGGDYGRLDVQPETYKEFVDYIDARRRAMSREIMEEVERVERGGIV